MQAGLRMIAVGLLGVIFAALPGARAGAVFAETSAEHPAGCHSHGPETPTPNRAPASYQCCVNGHHAAIPNASFASRALEARSCGMSDASGLRPDLAHDRLSLLFVVPSCSPPRAVSLRI